MKKIVTLLFLFGAITLSAQSTTYEGIYELKFKTEKNELLEYTLTLNKNGDFLFHFYRDLQTVPEENRYGKGK